MRLIVIRESKKGEAEPGTNLLRYALATAPLADVVVSGLLHLWCCQKERGLARSVGGTKPGATLWAIPQDWHKAIATNPGRIVSCASSSDIHVPDLRHRCAHPWAVISNGRLVSHTNCELLGQVLADTHADVLAVTVTPDLLAYRERVRLTPDNELVGYRRLYGDSIVPSPAPADWPDHLFVRREAVDILFEGGLPSVFAALMEKCRAHRLNVQSVTAAGSVCALESASGILALCQAEFNRSLGSGRRTRLGCVASRGADGAVSPQARLIGPVLLGERVVIEADAVIVGPSVLCNDSVVRQGATVDSSIVGAGARVEPQRVVRNRVLVGALASPAEEGAVDAWTSRPQQEPVCCRRNDIFRVWPRFSYARCFKRAADVAVALVVLVLFAPVLPFMALAVKLSSPGPVFFRDKRQGLHGRLFACIKFRTMRQGADKIQEKLRFVSEVDGPQFKMADDPRITVVGRFMRETYLDEIPQFFNVLCGQMSVVGPRPSPEAENTLCPSWRDARLSVRPGITGLWQVCRTREPHKDFQEWIHYDTQYVRELSLGLDLWICWRTCRRMIENFISQF